MNIQSKNVKSFSEPRPTNFVEATIQMAKCYENALEAGVKGDDDATRYWIDKSRTVKSFFKKYHDNNKSDLVDNLEQNNSKQILRESLAILKCAEPFIGQWVNRFKQLSITKFENFYDLHWDIFIDFIVPLTWDWDGDVFVIQHDDSRLITELMGRGQKRIIVIEPDKKKLKSLQDDTDSLKNGKYVHFVDSKKGISKIISSWVDNPPFYSRVITADVFKDDTEKVAELKEINTIVHDAMINAITFDNTIKSHDTIWIANGLGNFVDLIDHPHIENLKNKFKDFPAIIVSPGPSLDGNIRELKGLKGKALIIAVSHSLEFLSDHDIVPDVVLHVDPNVNIHKYFEKFDMSGVELFILSATTDPDLFRLPSKQKAWIYANAYFDNWLMEINNIEEYTLYGSCVSVAALKMCYTWGCKSVALIGQDLSFKENKYYAGNTFAPDYIIDGFDESSKSLQYKLPGYYGGKVVTKNDYRVYHGQFEQLAEEINEKTKVPLYNCTEGGANISGFQNIPLVEFVDIISSPLGKVTGNKSIADIIGALDHSIDRSKIRSNLTKTKRLLTEVENLMHAAIKKTNNAMVSSLNEERSVQNIQKKIARKIKKSMFLKMALQDPLTGLAESEKYQNNREGYIKKGNEMYKACLEVVIDLKKRIHKIKV